MIACNACAGEQVRFINEKQMVSGCAYCTAVSMFKLGFIDKPENHCSCYASNPREHLANHRDTKLIGHNFNLPDNTPALPPSETQEVETVVD